MGEISYDSSDDKVAVVDANGVVTGKSKGTAVITVIAAGDAHYEKAEKEILITVVNEDETEPGTGNPSETETEPDTGKPGETETEPDTGKPGETETEPDTGNPGETETEPDTVKPGETDTEPDTGNKPSEPSQTERVDLSSCTITLSQTSFRYNGAAQKPVITVKDGCNALKEGSDFTVSYANNRLIGTAKVTITGKDAYTGEVTKTFTINVGLNSRYTIRDFTYKIKNTAVNGTGTAIVVGGNSNIKKLSLMKIPDKVNVGGVSFKVTAVGNEAFKKFTRITRVTLGKNITEIGAGAFSGCKSLKTVRGCISVKKVGKYAFYGCQKLSTIGSSKGQVSLPKAEAINKSAFRDCKAVKSVSLASGYLTAVNTSAFKGCTSLKKVSISSKRLSSIGKYAFYGCSRLNRIDLKTKKLNNNGIGRNAFKGINSACTFQVPARKLNSYRKLFKAKGAGDQVVLTKNAAVPPVSKQSN